MKNWMGKLEWVLSEKNTSKAEGQHMKSLEWGSFYRGVAKNNLLNSKSTTDAAIT